MDAMSVRATVPASLQCPHCDSKEEIRAWRALAVISYVCVQCGQTWTIDVEPDPQPSKPLETWPRRSVSSSSEHLSVPRTLLFAGFSSWSGAVKTACG